MGLGKSRTVYPTWTRMGSIDLGLWVVHTNITKVEPYDWEEDYPEDAKVFPAKDELDAWIKARKDAK